jgi:peptidoglycan/LPS O-acetylase OafA/YrhL
MVTMGEASGSANLAQGTTAPFRLGNRPALTGVRAPLVMLVLIFHSNFRTFPGAWMSLGVFFVLSGFLITSMLAIEHQRTDGISLSKFYSRRGVRLLPPLLLAIVIIAIYAAIVPVGNAANRIWGDAAAALFYVADYRSAFGHEPLLGYMSQCWSLAVEEQFYLVWAVLFVVALKFGNRKWAYLIATLGVIGCTANRVRIVLDAAHWNPYVAGRVYYAFDTRADALFVGCLLGLIATGGYLENWKTWAKRTLTVAAVVSTVLLVWIVFNVGLAARSLPLWWLPVTEVASAVIIVYFVVKPEGLGSRAMSIPLLVLVGNMSYTIYILHWPIYVATGVFSPTEFPWSYWPSELARLAIIFALAAASWYLMERPLTRWRRRALSATPTVAEASDGASPDPGPVPVPERPVDPEADGASAARVPDTFVRSGPAPSADE